MKIEEKLEQYLNETSYKKKKLDDEEYYIKEQIPKKSWRVIISDDPEFFAQITKENNRKWNAEIRDAKSGSLLQYPGIWKSKKEAIEEAIFALKQKEKPGQIMKDMMK